MEQLRCRPILLLGRHIHPEKTVSYCTVEALAFWPRSAFQRKPAWIWSQGGHTLEKQYKEGGMSVGSEKNREATSCQGFLSFLYFFFSIAPYWQRIDYSLVLFSVHSFPQCFPFLYLYLLHPPLGPFPPTTSPGFPSLTPGVLSSQDLFPRNPGPHC